MQLLSPCISPEHAFPSPIPPLQHDFPSPIPAWPADWPSCSLQHDFIPPACSTHIAFCSGVQPMESQYFAHASLLIPIHFSMSHFIPTYFPSAPYMLMQNAFSSAEHPISSHFLAHSSFESSGDAHIFIPWQASIPSPCILQAS